jgi:hypothetical protein
MRRKNDTVDVFDGSGELVDEFIEGYPKTARKLEKLAAEGEVLDLSGDLEGFRPEEDPSADLNEHLLRDAAGTDPAPHLGDEELYRRWKEAHNG